MSLDCRHILYDSGLDIMEKHGFKLELKGMILNINNEEIELLYQNSIEFHTDGRTTRTHDTIDSLSKRFHEDNNYYVPKENVTVLKRKLR